MKEPREVEESHMAQQPMWLLNDTYFKYNIDLPTNNNKKNNTSYSIKKTIKIPKKLTKNRSKSIGKKVGFAAIFTDITEIKIA